MDSEQLALWKVRNFGEVPGDLELVNGWREAHGADPVPLAVIPPLALIAERNGEPQAFGVLYQSYGVGVCFGEWFTARPGLTILETSNAVGHVLGGLCAMTKETHKLIFGYCDPVICRMLQRYGFKKASNAGIQVVKLIE